MKARNENLTSIDAIMDAEFGKPGTPEREEFRKEAYAYCMGQIICDARKKEKMTQSELAEKIGTNKSYISRIEKGIVDPGISTFCRLINQFPELTACGRVYPSCRLHPATAAA